MAKLKVAVKEITYHGKNYQLVGDVLQNTKDLTFSIVENQGVVYQSARPEAPAFLTKAIKVKFSWDNSKLKFEGYTFLQKWNGWDAPYFEKSEAMKISEQMKGVWTRDGEVITLEAGEELEEYEVQTIETVDGPKQVYAIGNGGWTWTIVEDLKFVK